MIWVLAGWVIVANLSAFFLMVIDKIQAEGGHRRVSESNLLFWIALGGAVGGFAASRLVRHKTRKQPFANILGMHLAVQIALLITWQLGWLDPLLDQLLALFRPRA